MRRDIVNVRTCEIVTFECVMYKVVNCFGQSYICKWNVSWF